MTAQTSAFKVWLTKARVCQRKAACDESVLLFDKVLKKCKAKYNNTHVASSLLASFLSLID